jgi:argininosuccinate synthase
LCEKGFDVIAFCANVGQHAEDFGAVKAKALNAGASKCIVSDLRKEFVTDYVFESHQVQRRSNESRYLLGTSICPSVHYQGNDSHCVR